MKKLLGISSAISTTLLLAPQVFAQNSGNLDPCQGAKGALLAACNGKTLSLGSVIGFIISMMFVIAVLISLFFLVWGGIKWITSGGDKTGVETARNQIIAAVIGLIIVFLAFFILNLVLGLFGLSLFNLQLPTLNGST